MQHFWFGIEQGFCLPPDIHAINVLQKLTNVIPGHFQGLLKNAGLISDQYKLCDKTTLNLIDASGFAAWRSSVH